MAFRVVLVDDQVGLVGRNRTAGRVLADDGTWLEGQKGLKDLGFVVSKVHLLLSG